MFGFGIVPKSFDSVKENREYLEDLIKEGLKWNWIRRAVHYETVAAFEGFPEPLEAIKMYDPKLHGDIITAKKCLKALMSNIALNELEKGKIGHILNRINSDYPKYKDLLDNSRSNKDITQVEDFGDDYRYPDEGFGWQTDAKLRTDIQCREKTVSMIFDYIEKFRTEIPKRRHYAFPRDYKQIDTFKLIAEILNLRFRDANYDHKKIKQYYENYLKIKY